MLKLMQQTMELPIRVKIWLGVMMSVFMAHIFYLDQPLMLLNMVGFFFTALVFGTATHFATGNVHALALAHFITWPTLLAHSINEVFVKKSVVLEPMAHVVLVAGLAVFTISLVLDYRDLVKQLKVS